MVTLTAPSSPKPEEMPAPTPPNEDDVDDEEAEEDEDPQARRSPRPCRTAAAVTARIEASRVGRIDLETDAHVSEKDGYIAGLVVGLTASLRCPTQGNALRLDLIDAIAAGYTVPPQAIREGVEDDADALLDEYAHAARA